MDKKKTCSCEKNRHNEQLTMKKICYGRNEQHGINNSRQIGLLVMKIMSKWPSFCNKKLYCLGQDHSEL